MIELIIKAISWKANAVEKWKLLQKFRRLKIVKRFNS